MDGHWKGVAMELFTAMQARKSTRAFLDKPVRRGDIEEIITYAGMAPSAINLQPWEYIITYGEEKERLTRCIAKAHAEHKITCGPGTSKPLPQRYAQRSRDALGIMKPAIAQLDFPFNQFIEEGSCSFYGAPIVIVITMDKVFPQIRYLDIGLSLGYLLLAAHAKGLGTCPIGLITAYADAISEVLSISKEKEILIGIALGYADEDSAANQFKTARGPLSEILSWYE